MKPFWALLLVVVLAFSPGCWTAVSIAGDLENGTAPKVYGGVRDWYSVLTHYDTAAVMAIFTILDVPFSFSLDSLLLPVTIPANIIELFIQRQK